MQLICRQSTGLLSTIVCELSCLKEVAGCIACILRLRPCQYVPAKMSLAAAYLAPD